MLPRLSEAITLLPLSSADLKILKFVAFVVLMLVPVQVTFDFVLLLDSLSLTEGKASFILSPLRFLKTPFSDRVELQTFLQYQKT